jgi:hypothetical protein
VWNIDHADPMCLANLFRSQPNTVRGIHGFKHIRNKGSDFIRDHPYGRSGFA